MSRPQVGTLAGYGQKWWGIPGVGYLLRGENRPRLLRLQQCQKVLVEKIAMLQSPYWTFYADSVDGLEVSLKRIYTHVHHIHIRMHTHAFHITHDLLLRKTFHEGSDHQLFLAVYGSVYGFAWCECLSLSLSVYPSILLSIYLMHLCLSFYLHMLFSLAIFSCFLSVLYASGEILVHRRKARQRQRS